MTEDPAVERRDVPILSTGPVEATGPVAIQAESLVNGAEGSITIEKPKKTTVTPEGHEVAVPTTTAEQNRDTSGQRRVNLIWEGQQAIIATFVVGTVLYVSARVTLQILHTGATDQQIAMAVTSFMLLSNIVNLVIGFYFGRTNHQRVGGVQTGR